VTSAVPQLAQRRDALLTSSLTVVAATWNDWSASTGTRPESCARSAAAAAEKSFTSVMDC
jgi:hypothetical protein